MKSGIRITVVTLLRCYCLEKVFGTVYLVYHWFFK